MSSLSQFVGKNFENWARVNALLGTLYVTQLDFSLKENVSYIDNTAGGSSAGLIVKNFPVFSGFEKKVVTYTVIIEQGASPKDCNYLKLIDTNLVERQWGSGGIPIKWLDGTIPTGNANSVDFFNIIVVNTGAAPGGSTDGSSLEQYEVFANLNGPYV
jgi:hypothetical protein